MKLISLNTWGGRALHPLMHFFKQRAADTDIFCLQEVFDTEQAELDRNHPDEHVRGDLFKKISAELKEFEGSFAYFDDNPHRQSLAVFIKRTVPVKVIADFVVHKPEQPVETGSRVLSARKLQYVTFDINGREFTVANFHGLWNGGPKTDNPERISQSQSVKKFLSGQPGAKVLCGDFNLDIDTESLKMLEEGMVNLVRSSGSAGTRTLLYREYNTPGMTQFADYMLVSPDIKVKRFEILPDPVSDHAAMLLDFE